MRAPPELVSDLTEALHAEAEARSALAAARERHRHAVAKTTAAVKELRSAGIPATAIACMVARAWGLTPSVSNRTRIAARLRQRVARDGVTQRHGDLAAASPEASVTSLQSVQEREETETTDMSQMLVKRVTTTETFLAEPDDEADDGAVGDLDDVDGVDDYDEDAERKPRRRPAPRPRRR